MSYKGMRDRRAVQCFTESLAVYTQIYVSLKLSLPLFERGDKIKKVLCQLDFNAY